MATIRKIIEIDATPEAVWAKISDVAGISNLIGFLDNSVLDGDRRVCTLADGGELKEDIISVDAGLKRVVYSIVDSPLNMDFHVATMEVQANGATARLIWSTDLLPAAAAEHIGPMLDMASKDMVQTLAA